MPSAQPYFVRFRMWLLALICVQVWLGAGIIYGWPELQAALIEEGVYEDLCVPPTSAAPMAAAAGGLGVGRDERGAGGDAGGARLGPAAEDPNPTHGPTVAGRRLTVPVCHDQLLKLNAIYVAASWGAQASGLLGFVLDRLGVKVTIAAASFGIAASSLVFAMSTQHGFNAWLPAMLVMGFCGNGIYLAAQKVGRLFPDYPNMSLFAITAFFAPGTLVFSFFHALEMHGVESIKTTFLLYAGFQALLTLVSLAVWPSNFDLPMHLVGDGGRDPDSPEDKWDAAAPGGTADPEDGSGQLIVKTPGGTPVPFLAQLKDVRFLAQVTFFSILVLPAQYYIGTLGSQISRLNSSEEAIDRYVQNFNLTYSGVSLITPLFGLVVDKLGFGAGFGLANLLMIGAFALFSYSPELEWFIVSYGLYTFARNAQFSTFFTYLAKTFGAKHMGKLMGIGFITSAMVSLLQAPLLHLVIADFDANYSTGNLVLMGLMTLLFAYCGWVAWGERREWREEARRKAVLRPNSRTNLTGGQEARRNRARRARAASRDAVSAV